MGSQSELEFMAEADRRQAMQNQTEALHAKVGQLQEHLKLIQIATKVLSVRAFACLSLLGGLGLFALAAIEPDTSRTVAAAGYAVLVFLPTLYWSRGSVKGE